MDFFNKKMFAVLVGVAGLLFLALAVSTGVDIYNKTNKPSDHAIVVSGVGEVYANPDLAVLNLSVYNEAATVGDAMAKNTQKMNNVISEIKKLGVDEKDLKSISYNISPRYDYPKSGYRVLAGYDVTQSLEVKIRDLSRVGDVIEKGTSAGANEIGNLIFTIENQDALKNQARQQAVQKAKDKANQMAGAVGVKLGKITNFSEDYYIPVYNTLDYAAKSAQGIGGAMPAPEIQSGQNKISVTITLTYEIK